jgi:hypothetical protein
MKRKEIEESKNQDMSNIEKFIKNLKLSVDIKILNGLNRSSCLNCNKKRMFYCYSCMLPLNELKNKIPNIKLPKKIIM